ncbi:MAG TPA: hypothetical protein VG269_22710 [Tepidisphaeraceae bacterium]|jgi:hypothetical protein|nr:hypothetical protein [Tepidisphaeraceae bacterium]
MQKFVKILEQHVQWIALALGAAYLGWMVYAYIVTPPVTVELGASHEKLTPGEADAVIVKEKVVPLEADINNKEPITIEPKDMLRALANMLGEGKFKPVELATAWDSPRYRPETAKEGPVINGAQVPNLPDLPPAVFVAESHYITTILVPAPNAAAPVPAAAGVPAPDAVAPPAMVRRDINYTSLLFKIDRAVLAANFNKTLGVPKVPALLQTMFTQVQLYRQEQDATGAWGAPVLVSSLPIYELMQYPGDAAPADPAGQVPFFAYSDWASENQEMIARPAFYETAPDAPAWVYPGDVPPDAAPAAGAPAAPARPFDPAHDTPTTPEQRKQAADYRNATNPRNGAGRPGVPPGYSGVRPGTIPPHGRTMPPAPLPTRTPPPAPGLSYPQQAPASGYRRPDALPSNRPNQNPLAGRFAPNLLAADIQILAHDVNVEEGKTYRYAVQYKLINPLFGFFNNGPAPADPKLMGVFSLSSPAVDPKAAVAWAKPIAIEPRTKIFVTAINLHSGRATFEVYIWRDGGYHQQLIKDLTPGDSIGSTPWTVVDVRPELRAKAENYVIVMDAKGNLSRRDIVSDLANPEHDKLKTAAGAAAVAK